MLALAQSQCSSERCVGAAPPRAAPRPAPASWHSLATTLPAASVQRACAACEDEQHSRVARSAVGTAGTTPSPETCPPPTDMDCLPAVDEPKAVTTTVAFAQDSARLGAREMADVDAAAAAWHTAGASAGLRIDGYASAEGDCGTNWLLSCRRAQAVAHELEHPSDHRPGVPVANQEILAHGESDTGGGTLTANRRATISVPAPTPVPTPAPACSVPCTTPVLLGTGRTGCGSGTDFTHDDHPSISAGSTAKLGAWAAAHTGGMPFRSMVSDADCMLEMDGVLAATAGSAGTAAFAHFVAGSGSTVTHGPGSTLGALALASPQFLATVATVRADIDTQLATQAASGPLDPCALSVVPPATSWRLSLIPALEAVIGGTHGEKLFADAFTCDAVTRTWSIGLRFLICDNFGVDEHDLYAPGLFPFWVLQHERGASLYAPFINELELPVAVSGTY
jgi:outer membrane protein OmpA-like peptidoglycan-associated protein